MMKVIFPKYFWLPEITGQAKQSMGLPRTEVLNDIIELENGRPVQTSLGKQITSIDEGLLNYYSNEQSQDLHQPELAFLVNVKFLLSDPNNPFPYLYEFTPIKKYNVNALEFLPEISRAVSYDFFRIKNSKKLSL